MLRNVRDSAPTTTAAETVSALVPALLRLAGQLTGDADTAVAVVRSVVGRVRHPRGDAELERILVAAVVRDRRSRSVVATGTALDGLPSPTRTAVVLAFSWGWDPATIAEVRRTTPRRIRRDVAGALAQLPEEEWRTLLAAPRWSVPVPADFQAQVRSAAASRRGARLRVALAVATAATLVGGVIVAVGRDADTLAPLPPTAHVAGLLAWPPRGPLVRDASVVSAAVRAWRASAQPPAGDVFVLYAGRTDGRRLVVLQALDATGAGVAAVFGETAADRTLSVIGLLPIDRPDSPALVLCCGIGTAGLQGGPGPLTERLLVAPGVTGVEERSPVGATPQDRPPFIPRTLVGGLSGPWPVDPGGPAAPAVRMSRRNASRFSGIVDPGSRQLLEVDPAVRPPSPRWVGLPRTLPRDALTDDVLWWAQTCGRADPSVQLVWVGGAPAFPAPVRMELVHCRGQVSAAFMTGFADGSVLLDVHPGRADAYATEFPAPPSFGAGTLLAVGSTRVHTIRVGTRVVHGRVLRSSLAQAGSVRALDAMGARLRVR
jgi:hypothetical protein